MLETSANSLEGREVVRCSGCLLNQFMTRSRHCRKCRAFMGQPIPATLQFSTEPFAISGIAKERGDGIIGKLAGFSVGPMVRIDLAILILRINLGLTQEQLASRMGRFKSYINKVERGRVQPWADSINKFAEALEVSPRQLIEFATV